MGAGSGVRPTRSLAGAVGLVAFLAGAGRPAESTATGAQAHADFHAEGRSLLDQIQSLDARRDATRRHHLQAAAERDAAQRALEEGRARQDDLTASERRSRSVVAGGSRSLWRVRGGEVLSGLLDDADRARSARTWRNLSHLVRYATAAMRAHAVRLADQATLVSTLEERALDLRELERRVAAAETDLELEQEAKRTLLVELLSDRERTLDAASATARTLDGLTAGPEIGPGPGRLPPDRRPAPRRAPSFAAWKGRLRSPVDGPILSRFGMDRDERGQTVVRSNGLRFAAKPDAPVRATLDGRVVHRGYVPGLGNVVILEHGDDYFTVYGHLGEVRATPGDEVARGETIATAGSSGLTEEPSVYFEVRHGAEALDPRGWLEPDTAGERRPKGSRGRK